MKIIYLSWGYKYDQFIIKEFQNQNIEVRVQHIPSAEWGSCNFHKNRESTLLLDILESIGDSINNSILFSIDFNRVVSEFCQEKDVPYCSWVLNLPNFDLYTKSIYNNCNYVGICDTYLVEKMWKMGIKKIFYLPNAIQLFENNIKDYEERGFCFLGNQDEVLLNINDISLYAQGYIDASIHSQRVNPNSYILETGLSNRVYFELLKCNKVDKKILDYFQRLYIADYYLAPYCTMQAQNIFLQNMQNLLTIYSNNEFDMCNCKKNKYIEDNEEKNKIYQKKEFTLVLADYYLHHGVSRQVLEIIAAGGFPICEYRADLDNMFEEGQNIAYFKNREQFLRLVDKYGNNKEERDKLLKKSRTWVLENHTYNNRIKTILKMWELL